MQGSVAWRNSFLALVSYLGAVACQFFFVEIWQIKIIATLGPSRFTMFGPWFLFIFSFIAISKPFNENIYLINFAKRFHSTSLLIRWRHVGLCSLLVGVLVIFYSFKSSSFELPDDDSRKLADFAMQNTDKNDIFALPFDFPRVDFPLKTGRGIFHGNGFPFSEKYFNEWDVRNSLINGGNAEIKKYPGSWLGLKYANHYRSLVPNDFINAASIYRLDWVVVESNFSNKFANCKADFYSVKYKAYSLRALKLCVE
jgi:hypothetical protein